MPLSALTSASSGEAVFFTEQPAALLYSAYGLAIRSDIPLPEFRELPVESDADVTISIAHSPPWLESVRRLPSHWQVEREDARFWFSGVAAFHVIGGREIRVSPQPGIDHSLLRMYVEGMMMATILFQRGYFVLHASVIAMDGDCVAFLGHVGAGKSSTAAALHARGHAVVTDDNAAIDLSAAPPLVTPAFPYVKIFPAIGASLGYDEASLTRMHSSQPKFVRDVAQRFPAAPLPISRIYVLTRDLETVIEPVSRAEAPIELIRNSVPSRWKLPGGEGHLKQCVQLASTVPMFRIRTFSALAELPALAERIERHRA